MPVEFSYCPYRLLFKHPFGTAHGVRTGTDAVFLRVAMDGVVGYGEATLPPYLEETVPQVVERLAGFAAEPMIDLRVALQRLVEDPAYEAAPGFRNAVHMALLDALSRYSQVAVDQILNIDRSKYAVALMTLGITDQADVAAKLAELPDTGAIKVKVDGSTTASYLKLIMSLTDSKLFIDANQGLERVEQALDLFRWVGPDRLLGLEQPFGRMRWAEQAELGQRCAAVVYGDESIWGPADLERAAGAFSGVNIKLMKCGGLDQAVAMARRAGALGMRVMLGSMSESSLGCTAMARLTGMADVADLDGPWLIRNDPFAGIGLQDRRLVVPDGLGIGAQLRADLEFRPSCA